MLKNIFNYDQYYIDLDFTIWNGCKKDFWAKKLEIPLKLKNNKIIDINNNFIQLQEGVIRFLQNLYNKNKIIICITLGGLLNIEYNNQLPIIALKMFNIYQYFNNSIILYKTDLKSNFINKNINALFIDDDNKNLLDVKRNCNIDVLDRKSFNLWSDLLG